VLPAASRLAEMEGIAGEPLWLLQTGALFHDIGYIRQYGENEPIAAEMALTSLPDFDYTPDQIEVVAGIILATRMPQRPRTLLEQIVCDADLDSLGRDDFFILSMKLRSEHRAFVGPVSLREWLTRQLAFLAGHSYFTSSAKTLRDHGKRENIEELKSLLSCTQARPANYYSPT